MPLYYIHFTGPDGLYEDLEGVELADDAAAREYAILDAEYLMDEGIARPGERPVWRVEIVDEAGRRLLSLPFSDLTMERSRSH